MTKEEQKARIAEPIMWELIGIVVGILILVGVGIAGIDKAIDVIWPQVQVCEVANGD